MPERARALLDQLITQNGETYASISHLLKKNQAYIQQYIKRGVPRTLKVVDQHRLAQFFAQPKDFLLNADASSVRAEAAIIADAIRRAIAGCDRNGFALVACHLQMGLDLLAEHQGDQSMAPSSQDD